MLRPHHGPRGRRTDCGVWVFYLVRDRARFSERGTMYRCRAIYDADDSRTRRRSLAHIFTHQTPPRPHAQFGARKSQRPQSRAQLCQSVRLCAVPSRAKLGAVPRAQAAHEPGLQQPTQEQSVHAKTGSSATSATQSHPLSHRTLCTSKLCSVWSPRPRTSATSLASQCNWMTSGFCFVHCGVLCSLRSLPDHYAVYSATSQCAASSAISIAGSLSIFIAPPTRVPEQIAASSVSTTPAS